MVILRRWQSSLADRSTVQGNIYWQYPGGNIEGYRGGEGAWAETGE